MKALITGASSGIGMAMAEYLSSMGWELIVTGRNRNALCALAKRLKTPCEIIVMDLAEEGAPKRLYELCRGKNVDFLINNAGFGVFGRLEDADLDAELSLLRVNILATHTLTKLFLRDFKKRNSGRILNVASAAAFMPGPLFASYYASKAYVLRLSAAVREELRREGSRVSISVLCPGPVDTQFNKRAGVRFSINPASRAYVAKYGVDMALRRRFLIVPTLKMKLCVYGSMPVPDSLLAAIAYNVQKKKLGSNG